MSLAEDFRVLDLLLPKAVAAYLAYDKARPRRPLNRLFPSVGIPDQRSYLAPGLHVGLGRAAYEAIDAINISRLAHFAEPTPAHAREAIFNPPLPTEALIFGTQFHCAVLEPERFERDFVPAPEFGDLRTKDAKALKADFMRQHPLLSADGMIDPEDYSAILRMRENVWSDPDASALLRGGVKEVTLLFTEPETGLLCKSLLDHVGEFDGWTWIVDLKSIEVASDREWDRAVKSMNYGAKLAFYHHGCDIVAPRERRAAWIAVEKKPPHLARVFEALPDALEAGWSKAKRWLRLYAEAKESGVWQGYPQGIRQMTAEDTEWKS